MKNLTHNLANTLARILSPNQTRVRVSALAAAVLCSVGFSATGAEVYFDTVSTEKAVRTQGSYWSLFGGGVAGTEADYANDYSGFSNSSENGFFVGTELGYEFHTPFPIRPALEVELFYVDTKMNAEGPDSSTLRADLQHINLMANVVLALDLGQGQEEVGSFASALHPYVGAGLGVAYASMGSRNIDTPEGKSKSLGDSSDFTFAYQVFAGLELDLGDYVSIYGEYRYLVLQELAGGSVSDFAEDLWGFGVKVKY